MKPRSKCLILEAVLLCVIVLRGPNAIAAVVPIGPFAPSTLITFTGLANGTEVNGLTVSGVFFSYSLGNGQVIIDGGPGVTNNVNPPNIVSVGNNTGTLTMLLPSPATAFGYGYAVLNTVAVANATTVSVFSGVTFLGSLSFDGELDPLFAGGFAGIQSTSPFNRVDVTFNSAAAPAFALDNIRIGDAVPEPSTIGLVLGAGLAGLLCYRRRTESRPSRL